MLFHMPVPTLQYGNAAVDTSESSSKRIDIKIQFYRSHAPGWERLWGRSSVPHKIIIIILYVNTY